MTDQLFIRQTSAPDGFVQPHRLSGLPPETPLLVAFSGGADSRLLAELAARYGQMYGAPVHLAHLHHGMRGEEADRDEAFCRRVARELGLPLYVEHADVPALAAASGRSPEHEAREARYDFLARTMAAHRIPLLLTAHHADDQLETLLSRLMRGAGTHGMCGIPPVRPLLHPALADGALVLRPLLGCSRRDILAACERLGLSYVTDSTNLLDDTTRNRIRHTLIPRMEALAGEGIPQVTAHRLTNALREDDDCLCSLAESTYETIKTAHGSALPVSALTAQHPAIAKRMLGMAYRDGVRHADDPDRSLTAAHLEALCALCTGGIHGAETALPGGVTAQVWDGTLRFLSPNRAEELPADTCPTEIPLPLGDTPWDHGRMTLRLELVPAPTHPLTGDGAVASAILPATALTLPLLARRRAPGDAMWHQGVHRKLKKLLCDKHVPNSLRDRLPLICTGDGATPLWFPTAGFADGYPPPTEGMALRITVLLCEDIPSI